MVSSDVDNNKYNSQVHLKICKKSKNKGHGFRSRLRNLSFNICTLNETQAWIGKCSSHSELSDSSVSMSKTRCV